MVKIKENLRNIKTSSTLAINELSKKLEKQGREIYKFGLGESPFPVPEIIVKELKKNAHQKNYLNVSGLLELRKHVAKYHSKKNKYLYEQEDILIGPGSKELIFQTQMALDSNLFLPSPSWVSYEPQANILNKKIYKIQCSAEQNWHLTAEALEEACKIVKNELNLLIINSPNNPSGTNHPNLQKLAKVAKKYNVIIISDEIYAELSFDSAYSSISHYYPEGTIISSGISKWCGAGGWRLGTLIFPKELNKIYKIIRNIASETFTTVSAPIQYAAIKAYSEDHSKYINNSRKILQCVSNYIYSKFVKAGLICLKSQGGFYMLCDFSKVINKTNEISDSITLCNKILDDTGFAMLPGADFGLEPEKLITRIAFVDFDGEHLLNLVSKNIKLNNNFVIQNCPKISIGIDKLLNWVEDQS